MLIRKKKRESAEWVPAAIVKAYLDRVRADEHATRRVLFGEEAMPYATQPISMTAQLTQGASPVLGGGADPKELDALRAQLSMADQRAMEFDRMLNALRAEKSALEQKLREAASAAPAAGAAGAAGGAPTAEFESMKKAYAEAQAKLDEYGLIEDELASLKKFQKENEQLKARVSQLETGGANLTVVPGGPAAPTPTTTIPNATEKITTPTMTVISGGAAPAAVAAPAAPVAAAPAPAPAAPAAETNTNVLAPVTPQVDVGAAAPAPAAAPAATAAAAPAGDKNPKQKEDELLSEFEKMLAS